MNKINLPLKIIGMVFLLTFFYMLINSFKEKNFDKETFYIKDGLIFNSSKNKIFSGRITDTLQNKIIKYDVVNGRKNGDFIIYYSNGNVQIKGTMKQNKNWGEWKYYYPSGQLESIGNFNNDLVSDEWTWFYETGIIKERGFFNNGLREGKWNLYDSAGKLKKILYFNHGKIITKIETEESKSI